MRRPKIRYPTTYEEFMTESYRKLSEIREWEVLAGQCPHCDRIGMVDMHRVRRAFGDQFLINIRRRLVCQTCKNRKENALLIGKLPR